MASDSETSEFIPILRNNNLRSYQHNRIAVNNERATQLIENKNKNQVNLKKVTPHPSKGKKGQGFIREEKDNDLTREQLDRSAQKLHKNEETTVEAGFKPGFIAVEGSNAHLPAGKESSPYKGNDGTLDSECFFKSPSIGKVQCEDTPRLPETEHSIEAEVSNQAEIAIAENRNQQQNYNLDVEEEMNQEITEQQNLRAGEETLEQVIPEQDVEIFPNKQVPKCLNAQEDADLGTYKEVVESREDQIMDASVSALVKTTNSMTMEVGPAAKSYNGEGHKASTLDSNQIFRVETTEEHDAREITLGEETKTKKDKGEGFPPDGTRDVSISATETWHTQNSEERILGTEVLAEDERIRERVQHEELHSTSFEEHCQGTFEPEAMMPGKITNMEDKNFKIFASGSIQNMNPEELDEEDLLNRRSQIEPERIIEEILHAEDQQDAILEETDYAHYNLGKTAVDHENPGETWELTTGEGENQGIDLEQTYADKENLTIRSIEDNTNQAEITGAEEQIDKETIKHETFQSISQIEEHLNMDSEDAEAAAPSEHAKQNAFARGIESVGYSLVETRKGEESIRDDKVNENGISYKSTEADLDGMTRRTDTDISKNTNEFIDQTVQTEGEKQDEVSKFELEEQIQKANDVSSEEKYIKEASEVSKSAEYESSEGKTTEEAATVELTSSKNRTEDEGQRKIYDMEAENKNAEEILETDKQRKETSSIVFQEVTVESDDTRKRIVEDAPIVSIPAHTEDETVDKSFNGVNLDGTALDICGEDSSHPAEDNPTREPFINEEELVMGKIGNKITEEENISEQAIEDVPQELTQGNAIQRSQDDNMEAANSWTEDRKEQIIEAGHVTRISPQWTIGNIVKTYAEDVRGEKEFQELETASTLNSTALEPQHDPDEILDSSTVKCDTSTKKDKTDLPPTELLINKNIVEEEMYGQVNENVNITEEGSLIKQSKDDEGTEQNLQKASPEDRPTKALNGVNELGEAALEQTSDTEMEEFTQTSAETSDEHKEEKETVGCDKKKENETSTEDKACEESRFRESIDWKLSTTDNLEVDNQERGSNSKIEEQPDIYNPNKSLEGRIKEEISGADSRDDDEECMGSNEALCRDISFQNGEEAVDTSCQENRKVEHYNEQATSELSHLTNEEVYMGPQNDKIDDSTKGFIEEVNPSLVSIKEEIIRSSQETDGEVTGRQVEMHKEHKAGENEDFGNMPNQETTTGDHSTEATAEEASEKSTEAVQTVAGKVESDEGLGEVYGTGSSDCEKVSEKNIYQEKAVLTGEEHAADVAGDDVEQEKTDEAPEARPKVEDEIEAATAGNPSDDVPEETIREITGNTEEEMQLQEEDNSRNTNVLQEVSAEKGEENTSEKINDMLMPLESYNQGNNSESGDIESQEEETIHAVSESSEANKSRIQKDDRGNQGFGKENLENASLGFEAFEPCIDNEHSSLKTEESAKHFSNVAKDFEEQETATADVDHHHHENEASNTVNQYVPAEEAPKQPEFNEGSENIHDKSTTKENYAKKLHQTIIGERTDVKVKESSGKEPEVSRASETLEKYPLPKDESRKPEDIPGSACKVSEETIKEENIGAADHHNQTRDHTSAAIQRDKQSLQEGQLRENLLEVIDVNENKKNQQVDDETEIAPEEEVDSNNLQGTLKVASNLPDIENDNRGKVGETVESLTAQEVAEIGVPGSAPEPTEEAPRETNENPFKEKMSSDDTAEGTKELNEVVFHTNYHDVEPTPKDDITSSQISPLNKTRQQSEHKLSELLQDEKEHEFLMPIKDTEEDNTNEVQVLKATGTNDFSSEKIRETAVEEVLTIDEAPILEQGDRSSQMPFTNSILESNTNTESNRLIDSCSREALDDKDIMGLNNWGKDINISPQSYSTGEHISQENYGKICKEASDSNLQNADASEHILELHDVIFTGSEDNNTKEENPEAASKKPTISGNIPEEVTKELLMLPTKEDDSLTTALNNTVDETSPAAKTMERIQLEKEDESRNSKMLLQLAENKKETRSQEMPENKDENLHMHPPELNTQSNISESEDMEIKKEEETHELKSTEDKQKTLKEDERFEEDNFGNENPNDKAPVVVYADGPHIDAEDASPKQDECCQNVEHSKQKVADVKEVVAPAELEHPKQENGTSIIVTDCASAEQMISMKDTNSASRMDYNAISSNRKAETLTSEVKESSHDESEAPITDNKSKDIQVIETEYPKHEDIPSPVGEVAEESTKVEIIEAAANHNIKINNTSTTMVTEDQSLQEIRVQEISKKAIDFSSNEENKHVFDKMEIALLGEEQGSKNHEENPNSAFNLPTTKYDNVQKESVVIDNPAPGHEVAEMERASANEHRDEAYGEVLQYLTTEKMDSDETEKEAKLSNETVAQTNYEDAEAIVDNEASQTQPSNKTDRQCQQPSSEVLPKEKDHKASITVEDPDGKNKKAVQVLNAEETDDSFSENITEEALLQEKAPKETEASKSESESSVNLHQKDISGEEVQRRDAESVWEHGDSSLQMPSANSPSESWENTEESHIGACLQENQYAKEIPTSDNLGMKTNNPPQIHSTSEQISQENFGRTSGQSSGIDNQKEEASKNLPELYEEVISESKEANMKEEHLEATGKMPTTEEYERQKTFEAQEGSRSPDQVEGKEAIEDTDKDTIDEGTTRQNQQEAEKYTGEEVQEACNTSKNRIEVEEVPRDSKISAETGSIKEEITEAENDAKKLHQTIIGDKINLQEESEEDSNLVFRQNQEATELNNVETLSSEVKEISHKKPEASTTARTAGEDLPSTACEVPEESIEEDNQEAVGNDNNKVDNISRTTETGESLLETQQQENVIQRSQGDKMEAMNFWTEDRKEQITGAGHVTGTSPDLTKESIAKTYAEDVWGAKEFQEPETARALNSTALEPQQDDPDKTLDSSTVKSEASTKGDKMDLPLTELLINKNVDDEAMSGLVTENVSITEEGSLMKQSKDEEEIEQNMQKASPEDRPTKALNGVNEVDEAALDQTSHTQIENIVQTTAETSKEHKEEEETVCSDDKKESETSMEDKACEESRFRESIDWKLITTDKLEVDNQERGSDLKIEEQPDSNNTGKDIHGRIKESGADSCDTNEECMTTNEALSRDISFHNGEEAVDKGCQEDTKAEHKEQTTPELSQLTNVEVYMGPQNARINNSTRGLTEEANPSLESKGDEIIRSSQEIDGEVAQRRVEMDKEHEARVTEDFGNISTQESTYGDNSTQPAAEKTSEESCEAVQRVAGNIESDEGLGEVYGTGSSDSETVLEKHQEKGVLTGEENAADEAGDDVEQELTDEAPEARQKVEDEKEATTGGNPSDDIPEEISNEMSRSTEVEMQLQEEDNSRNTNAAPQEVSASKEEENTIEKINKNDQNIHMPLVSHNQGDILESNVERQKDKMIHAVSESRGSNKSRTLKEGGNQAFGKENFENALVSFEAFESCTDTGNSSLKKDESSKNFSDTVKIVEEKETATVEVDSHQHENEASRTITQKVPEEEVPKQPEFNEGLESIQEKSTAEENHDKKLHQTIIGERTADEVKESSGKEPEVSRASETLEEYPLPKDESRKPEDIPRSACEVPEKTIKEENIGAADHHNQTRDNTSAATQRDEQSLQVAQLQENLLEVIEINENKKNQQADDETEIAPEEEVDSNSLQGTLKVASNLPDIENDNRGKVSKAVESLIAQEVAEIGVPSSAPESTEEAPRETNENPFKEKMSSDDTAEGTKELNEVVFHTNYHDVEPTPKVDITSSQISPLNKTRQQSEHKLSELLQDEKEHEFFMPIKDTEDDNTNEVQVLKATGTDDFSSEKIRETAVEEVLTIDEAPILEQGDRSSQMPFTNSISESNTFTESDRPIDSFSREALDDKDNLISNKSRQNTNISPQSYSTGEHISQDNYGKTCKGPPDSKLQETEASEHILEPHDVIVTESGDTNIKDKYPEVASKKSTISGDIPEKVTKEFPMPATKEDESLSTALNNMIDETSLVANTIERMQLEKEDESRNSKMLLQLAENEDERASEEIPENKDENLHIHPPELSTQSNISKLEDIKIKKEEETQELSNSTEDKQKTLKDDKGFAKDNFGNENPNDEGPMAVDASGPHIDTENTSPKQDECSQFLENSAQEADLKEVVAPAEVEHPKHENETSTIVTDCASAEQVPKYSEICGETARIREEITEEKSNAENLHQAIIGGKTNLQGENSNLVSIQNQEATFLNKVENMNSEEKESTNVKQEASIAARTLNDCATLGEIKRPEDVPRTVSEVPEESIKEDNQETADKYNNKVDNTSMTTVTEEESLQETQQQENLSHSDGSTEKNQQTREKTGNAQEREEVDSVADYSDIDREHSGKKIVAVENQAACESSEMERILGTVNNPEDEASSETATNPTVEKLYLDELPPDGRKQDAPISIKDTEEVNPNEVGVLKAEGADDSFSEKILEETCVLDEAPRETAVSDSGYESSVNLHPKESTEEVQMIDPSSVLEYGDSLLQIPSANPPSETEKKTLPDRPIDSCSQNNDFSLHGHPPGEQSYEESFGNSYKGQSDSDYQKTGTSGHIQKLPDEVVTESEETNFKERHLQAASRRPTTQEYQWEKASEGENVIASEASFSEVEREGSIKESNKQSQDEDTETPSQQEDKLMDEESTMMEENQVSITRTNEIPDDQVPKELEINEKNESVQEKITEEESDAKKLHRVITGERTAQEMSFLIDSDSMPILNHETTDLNKRTDTMSSCIEVFPQEGTTDTMQTTDSIQEIRPLEEAPGNDEEHEQAESNPIATIQLIDPAGKAAAGVQPQSATEENLLTDEVENSMIEKEQIPDGAGQEKTGSEGTEKVKSVTMDSTEISSDLQQMSAAETYQMEGRLIEKGELTENNERMQTKEVETVENSKTEEEKEEAEEEEEEEGDEHKDNDPDSKAQVMVDAPKDTKIKGTHKKSHNILSGIKHSISKVKKAITGKSSHHKTSPPK